MHHVEDRGRVAHVAAVRRVLIWPTVDERLQRLFQMRAGRRDDCQPFRERFPADLQGKGGVAQRRRFGVDLGEQRRCLRQQRRLGAG